MIVFVCHTLGEGGLYLIGSVIKVFPQISAPLGDDGEDDMKSTTDDDRYLKHARARLGDAFVQANNKTISGLTVGMANVGDVSPHRHCGLVVFCFSDCMKLLT